MGEDAHRPPATNTSAPQAADDLEYLSKVELSAMVRTLRAREATSAGFATPAAAYAAPDPVFVPRRVVTGINAQSGKSTIVCDGPPPELLPDGRVQGGLMDFWTTSTGEPHDVSMPQERSSDPTQTSAISPPHRGTKFR